MIRTCSTGYTGFIHVNFLGGGHTYLHCKQKQFQETSCATDKGWHMPGFKEVVTPTPFKVIMKSFSCSWQWFTCCFSLLLQSKW